MTVNTTASQPAAATALDRAQRADEPFPDHHNDLAATLKFAWQMVGRGVQDRRSAFHTPVLATQSLGGPQARVLVLRAADAQARTLTFHTDTDQRIADNAGLGDARFQRQVRALKHGDANHVASAQHIVHAATLALSLRRTHAGDQGHQQPQSSK